MLGSDGKLYGTTSGGGVSSGTTVSGLGTFFAIDRTGTNFAKLHDFVNANGTGPSSKVIEQAPGVFLGLTSSAGNCGYGTIWRYSAAGDTVTGNTRCGQKKNNSSGGGSAGFAVLLLLGGLGLLRRSSARPERRHREGNSDDERGTASSHLLPLRGDVRHRRSSTATARCSRSSPTATTC